MMVDNKSTLILGASTSGIVGTVILGILVGVGGIAGGVALALNGWWILGLIAALAGVLIVTALLIANSRKYIIDEDGVETWSLSHKPKRINWVDIRKIDSFDSITLVGREAGAKLKVSSGIKGFADFLDLLEKRLEYEHWLRAAAADLPDVPHEEGGVFRKGRVRDGLFFSVLLWIAAIAFSLRSDVFAGQHLAVKGRGALAALLFNFLFVDQPFLGILTLSGLAFGLTYHVTRGWHTLRVEQEGLKFESLLGVRSIIYEEVVSLEYKIGRVQMHRSIRATTPMLLLKLDGGKELRLFGAMKGLRVKDAIEAAMAAHLGKPIAM
jgi:hypothetical protein